MIRDADNIVLYLQQQSKAKGEEIMKNDKMWADFDFGDPFGGTTVNPAKTQPRDTMPRFASFASLMPEVSADDFSAFAAALEPNEYRKWILEYIKSAERNRENDRSDRYNQGCVNTLLKNFREKCAARLQKAKADMNDPFVLFPDAEIAALSDLGLPEASFLYVEKYANAYQLNVWDEDHLKRLEEAMKIGFPDSTMTNKAKKLLGDLYWKTGKDALDKGKRETDLERIRLAEEYGNAQAKQYRMASSGPNYDDIHISIPSEPRETVFRHYVSNEKIFEQDGKYITESGREVKSWELD